MIMFSVSKFVCRFRTSALVWLVLVVTRFSRQTTFRTMFHLATRSALGSLGLNAGQLSRGFNGCCWPMGQEEPPHKGERLKIATYNVSTLINDEHVQELEKELKENNMKWDVIGLGEVRRKEESVTTLQSGHLLYHSEANNGQAGVGFLVNKKWKDNITRVSSVNSRVAELVLRITDRYQLKIVHVYAPTTSHSDEETDNFYNTIDKIPEKQTHYTIVMGDFNAKVGGQTNTSERATGCFGLGQRNERGDTIVVEWATSNILKIMNTQFQKKAGRRWTWRSPDEHTKIKSTTS